jgi:hopanoid biosynthesis associated protein HpnK
MSKRRVIVTADDFGRDIAVNQAVEAAHRDGILSAASLMVTAPAAADAVERAQRMPTLGVGLHLVLVDGVPALAPERIPDLVGPDGRFTLDPVRIGIKLFFMRSVQRQVEAELRAQFDRFLAAGLPLDHVDGHHHFHQHPSIVSLLIKLSAEYGIPAVRLPQEPFLASYRAQGDKPWRRLLGWILSVPRFTRMRQRLNNAGIRTNDAMFGLHDSGDMNTERLLRFLHHLPDGLSEVYLHPARDRWQDDCFPAHYRCVDEFQALLDPHCRQQIESADIKISTFGRLGQQTDSASRALASDT